MKLEEIDIKEYKEKLPANDVYIHNFIDILQDLTSKQGVNTELDTKYERNVMLNLMFQYGHSLAKQNLNKNFFIIGGDMRKYLNVSSQIDSKILESYNNIRKRGKKKLCIKDNCADISISPDIVIHTSNDTSSITEANQHLILEAKTTKSLCKTDFFWDLFKLNVYKKKLLFRHLVYYIYGSDKQKIKQFLEEYKKKQYYGVHCKDILFIIQPKIGEMVRFYHIVET